MPGPSLAFPRPFRRDLQQLKDALRIPEIWQKLDLPGTPRAGCRSPFRPDRHPSFSIYDDGRKWKDFATGESGDAIEFIAHAANTSQAEAIRRFRAMNGETVPLPMAGRAATPSHTVSPTLTLPPVHPASLAEIEAVARSRDLDPAAVSLAHALRTLRFGVVCGHASWILGDRALRVAEARRVDGLPYPALGSLGERKAHTLRGSAKSWPAGVAVLRDLPTFRAIMMVEGGPDYLAALHFALAQQVYDVLPVAMLGRGIGSHIDPKALDLLDNRRVRIYPHHDADGGGMASAETWATQLQTRGCTVDLFPFDGLLRTDGRPVKDLNDAILLSHAQDSKLNQILP